MELLSKPGGNEGPNTEESNGKESRNWDYVGFRGLGVSNQASEMKVETITKR